MAYLRPNRRVNRRHVAMGADMTDQEFRTRSLAELQKINTRTDEAAREERFQKWVQIGVTAAIPVFAGAWKIIGRFLSKGE